MPKPLPPRPDLDQLRSQARELLKAVQTGDTAACQRVADSHPRLQGAASGTIQSAGFKLSDAQLVLAREHGFASWPKLKSAVEALVLESVDPVELARKAFTNDDAKLMREILHRHPALKSKINEPVAEFDSPAVLHVRSRAMLDVLLDAGADINARSRWWAGGFGLLHLAGPDLAAYAVQRGAVVDAHAAARLGMLDRLRELIAADPGLVNAPGGDGQTPLHFAKTLPIAEFLLDHGAQIDARDVDHESTPAQYMIRDRQDIVRFLIRRGCRTDLLMAAALGDLDLVRQHLDSDPASIRMRVSKEYFPMINLHAGGTIYQWTLGWYVSAHDVARDFKHRQVLNLLQERSPADLRLIDACWTGEVEEARRLLAEHPGLPARLSESDRRQVAHAARNNNTAAVRSMLAAGFPVTAVGQHQATPLHWAAFHGNAEMTRDILRYDPPLEVTDADFRGTPLRWAIYGSEHGWYCRTGDYAGTVEVMLKAGATIPGNQALGTEAVKAVLRRHGATEPD